GVVARRATVGPSALHISAISLPGVVEAHVAVNQDSGLRYYCIADSRIGLPGQTVVEGGASIAPVIVVGGVAPIIPANEHCALLGNCDGGHPLGTPTPIGVEQQGSGPGSTGIGRANIVNVTLEQISRAFFDSDVTARKRLRMLR